MTHPSLPLPEARSPSKLTSKTPKNPRYKHADTRQMSKMQLMAAHTYCSQLNAVNTPTVLDWHLAWLAGWSIPQAQELGYRTECEQ
jgi:hypothetical protein